jgi:hypothetical protein
MSWLERYSGEGGYENARASALRSGLTGDPAGVARLLEGDAELRAELMPQLTSAWVARDRAAAEQWVLDRPAGSEQDQGIEVLLRSSAGDGEFDVDLLGRMSSNAAREQALLSSLSTLGRSNPALARQLINELVRDPATRSLAEERLESMGASPARSVFPQ